MPNPDRTCPSCRVNVDEVDDDQMRRITVRDMAVLPELCVQCGAPTKRHVVLKASRWSRDGTARGTRIVLALVLLVVGLVLAVIALAMRGRKRREVAVRLSLCPECPEPHYEHVDFDRGEITFLGHKALRSSIPERELAG